MHNGAPVEVNGRGFVAYPGAACSVSVGQSDGCIFLHSLRALRVPF